MADLVWGRLAAGTRVARMPALFPRIDSRPAVPEKKAEPATAARLSIDEFAKVELRVAEVIGAENVPKSKKLLKLTVRVGEETRTVVAGIAEHYAPADLVGRKVVIVANLAPATLMGVESNGMVLAASHEGKLALLTLDKELPSGSKVT
jgi:methionyl-tRNA synthetase